MALKQSKRISELTALESASLQTTLVGVDNGTTYKVTLDVLEDAIINMVSRSTDLRLDALELYTSSYSASSIPNGTISSSAQISAFGFISSSHTDITSLNSFTSSQNTLNSAFTNGINARLQTSSFNDFSASIHTEIVAATNEQSFNGLISGSSQLTSSYDERYVLSGSIAQTTWDNIANIPSGIVSQSTDIADFTFTNGTITNGEITLHATNSDIVFNADGAVYIGSSNAGNGIVTDGYLAGVIGDTNTVNNSTGHTITDNLTNIINSIPTIPIGTISGSEQITALGFISSSQTIDTGSLATTGSNTFNGNETISGSLFISGTTELGGNIVPKEARGATLGTQDKPFADIFIQSASIHIQSDTPGVPDTTLSNVSGNILLSAGGMQLLGDGAFNAATGSFQYLSGSFNHIGTITRVGNTILTGSWSLSGSTYYSELGTSLSTFSSSLNSRIIAATNEQSFNGLISGSSQLTSSFDTRYTLSGSISSTPSGTISGSSQITLLGFVSSSITASSFVSASSTTNVILFTKGDGSTLSVTVATGSGTFVTGSYATFHDTTTQSGSASTAYVMKLNTTDNNDGIILSGSGGMKVLQAGTYDIEFSAQMVNGAGSEDVDIWLRKNGTNVTDSNTQVTIPSNHKLVAAWNWQDRANANDVYEIMWSSTSGNSTISAIPSATSPTRPAVPSVIATIHRVDVGGGSNMVTTGSFNAYTSSINNWTSSVELKGSGIYSSSAQLPNGLISGSSQLTASYDTRYTLSGSVVSGTTPAGTISGSAQISAFGFVSGSYTTTSSFNSFTASALTTGSNTFSGSQIISGALYVTSITSISSSFSLPSGSSLMILSGSNIYVDSSGSITGSLSGSIFGIGDVVAFSSSVNSRLNSAGGVAGTISSSAQITAFGFVSGSYETTGRSIVSGSSQLTSSYDTRYTLSGSVSAVPGGTISGSAQITAFGFVSGSYETTGRSIVSGSSQLTSSFDSRYVLETETGSLQTSITNLNSTTASLLIETLNLETFSSSVLSRFTTLGTYTSSLNIWTSSIATTGSNSFNGNQTITGSLNVSSIAVVSSSFIANSSSLTLNSGSNFYLQNNGIAQITGSLVVSGSTISLITSVLQVGTGSGDEGGEILLAKSQTNNSLTGSGVTIDSYQNRLRIFEQGGNARGVFVDLTKAPNGVAGELLWKAGGLVNADVDVTLGNLKARIPSTGNRSLQLSTVSGTYSVYGSGVYSFSGISGTTIASGSPLSITTTPAYIIPSYNFTVAGAVDTWTLMDTSAGIAWRITMIIGASYNNNMISIERLV